MTTESEVKEMFKSGAHYGYSKTRRHPSAKPFIFGVKNNVEIFDLEKTADYLQRAKDFVKQIASQKGVVLFASSKNEAKKVIEEKAKEIGMPYVAGRWIGGAITNFSEIRKRIDRLENLISQREKGELSKYTKKERLLIDREIEKLQEMFGGLTSLKAAPQLLFVVDSRKESTAVREAGRKKIPVISLSGSDCDLDEVDFPIPANDSSMSSITYFVEQIAGAYREGLEK